jgi:hypothetical protein
MNAPLMPVLVRWLPLLTAGGALRRIHVVMVPFGADYSRARALCGAGAPQGAGFEEVDGAEQPTCPVCARIADGGGR